MVNPIAQRMSAQVLGGFVLFLIGLRINKPWKIHKWLPVFLAMPRMLRELAAHPESGFLGHVMSPRVIVQYWRLFDHLEVYARSKDHEHWPAWVGSTRGSVEVGRTSEFGTKRIKSSLANMRLSTAGCRRLGSDRSGSLHLRPGSMTLRAVD